MYTGNLLQPRKLLQIGLSLKQVSPLLQWQGAFGLSSFPCELRVIKSGASEGEMTKNGYHAEVQACTEVPEVKHERRAGTPCLARGHWP